MGGRGCGAIEEKIPLRSLFLYVSDKNGGVNFAILTELQDSAGKLLTMGALICIIRYIIKLFNKVFNKWFASRSMQVKIKKQEARAVWKGR